MTFVPTPGNCDNYLGNRNGKYDWRAVRYRAAADAMVLNGLADTDTIFDIGAGWTELDYCLRVEYNWRGRYVPVDGGIDGTNLEAWEPPRESEWFVALEILEHLYSWRTLTHLMLECATKGVIFSTPNPATTDVFGMDATHVVEVDKKYMQRLGFTVTEEMFYGGVFSNGLPDSLFGVYIK